MGCLLYEFLLLKEMSWVSLANSNHIPRVMDFAAVLGSLSRFGEPG